MNIENKVKKVVREVILFSLSLSGIYKIMRFLNRKKPMVMVYHDICEQLYESNNYNVTISNSDFLKQIRYLHKRYNFITIEQFINWKFKKVSLPNNSVLLTFDDGHLNNFNILKVLNYYNIKAVFFIKTGSLGVYKKNYFEQLVDIKESEGFFKTKNDFNLFFNNFRKLSFKDQCKLLRNDVHKETKDSADEMRFSHMDIKMCKELVKQGHSIQSHTVNHYILSSLEDSQSYIELEDSYLTIKDKFNKPLAIAYPFGDSSFDFGTREKKYACDIGYKLGFSGELTNGQFINRKMDNFSLPRFGLVKTDFNYFKMLISGLRIKK